LDRTDVDYGYEPSIGEVMKQVSWGECKSHQMTPDERAKYFGEGERDMRAIEKPSREELEPICLESKTMGGASKKVAKAYKVSHQTAYKWIKSYGIKIISDEELLNELEEGDRGMSGIIKSENVRVAEPIHIDKVIESANQQTIKITEGFKKVNTVYELQNLLLQVDHENINVVIIETVEEGKKQYITVKAEQLRPLIQKLTDIAIEMEGQTYE
jgi:hypothetical protein